MPYSFSNEHSGVFTRPVHCTDTWDLVGADQWYFTTNSVKQSQNSTFGVVEITVVNYFYLWVKQLQLQYLTMSFAAWSIVQMKSPIQARALYKRGLTPSYHDIYSVCGNEAVSVSDGSSLILLTFFLLNYKNVLKWQTFLIPDKTPGLV